jgi:hypothetical protein
MLRLKPLAVLLLALFLGGCATLNEMIRVVLPGRDTSQVVVPSFLLTGPAARLQDSLRPRLEWLSKQKTPTELLLVRLSFRNRPDSTVELRAVLDDDHRMNSHGLTPEEIRRQEAKRIGSAAPLIASVRSAGIQEPLVVRARFRHRDYMFQASKTRLDSVDVQLADSTRSTAND